MNEELGKKVSEFAKRMDDELPKPYVVGWSAEQKEAIREQLIQLFNLGYSNAVSIDDTGLPYLNNDSVKQHIDETLERLEAITKGKEQ